MAFEKLKTKLYVLYFDTRIIKSINIKYKINTFELIKKDRTKIVIIKAFILTIVPSICFNDIGQDFDINLYFNIIKRAYSSI